jgi:hypothetical protein
LLATETVGTQYFLAPSTPSAQSPTTQAQVNFIFELATFASFARDILTLFGCGFTAPGTSW